LGEARGNVDPEVARALLDQLRKRLAERRQSRREPRSQLRVAHRVGPELDLKRKRVRLLIQVGHPVIGAAARALREIRSAREKLPVLAQLAGHMLLEQGKKEIFLAFEIRIDRPSRGTRLPSDLLDRGGMKSPPREDPLGRVEQPRARERPLLLAVGGPSWLRMT